MKMDPACLDCPSSLACVSGMFPAALKQIYVTRAAKVDDRPAGFVIEMITPSWSVLHVCVPYYCPRLFIVPVDKHDKNSRDNVIRGTGPWPLNDEGRCHGQWLPRNTKHRVPRKDEGDQEAKKARKNGKA